LPADKTRRLMGLCWSIDQLWDAGDLARAATIG
jgi:hypothetical protein